MAVFHHQRAVLMIVVGLLLASCSPFTSKKPPVVLILLESFSEQDYLCADSRKMDDLTHLQEVCDDFLRYTHVYAPTTLTQPNISSILTGLPLSKHNVTHNGSVGISNRIQTLAEDAINSKMRTAFFSGGVPILKKFGIGQGFEEFHEPFQGRDPKFFRSFSQSVRASMRWLDDEVQKGSFFLTFYAPDLLYKNRVTQDGLDNERPISRASSVLEIHETIDELIGELKARKKWKKSHFVVVGLSGPDHSLRPYNPLSGQYLHVPLQIKVSSLVKTNLGELTSEILSFAKLGRWLQKLIQHKPQQGDLILSPEPSDIFIPQQNTWSLWRDLSNWATQGLRRKHYLFVFNPDLKVFDTFFDKKEYEPVLQDEGRLLADKFDVIKQMKSFFPKFCHESLGRQSCPPKILKKSKIKQLTQLYRWHEQSWMIDQPVDRFQERMDDAFARNHSIVIRWLAYRALYERRWVDLFELGKKAKNLEWKLISQLNLRETPGQSPERCLRYFVGEKKNVREFYQNCQDSGLRRVVEGINRLRNKKRPSEGFWTQVNTIRSRRQAKRLNLAMLFINDIHEPFDFAPTLSELYFFLPDNVEFLELIDVDKS